MIDTGERNEFPFEFHALEVALEAIYRLELEIDAYPALEELISKGIFLNVVISKTTMVLVLPMGFPNSPAIGSKISRANTAAATQEDNDIEEFEIEAYHTQIDGTLNKLIMLREYVDDTRIMSIFSLISIGII
ncbi:hypothetical protein ACOSQ3_001419 [Xanthoceras sorbifolium]